MYIYIYTHAYKQGYGVTCDPCRNATFFSKAPTTFHGICSVLEIRQPKSDFKIGYPRVAGDICMHFVLLFTVYFRRVYKIFSGVLYLVDFFG